MEDLTVRTCEERGHNIYSPYSGCSYGIFCRDLPPFYWVLVLLQRDPLTREPEINILWLK